MSKRFRNILHNMSDVPDPEVVEAEKITEDEEAAFEEFLKQEAEDLWRLFTEFEGRRTDGIDVVKTFLDRFLSVGMERLDKITAQADAAREEMIRERSGVQEPLYWDGNPMTPEAMSHLIACQSTDLQSAEVGDVVSNCLGLDPDTRPTQMEENNILEAMSRIPAAVNYDRGPQVHRLDTSISQETLAALRNMQEQARRQFLQASPRPPLGLFSGVRSGRFSARDGGPRQQIPRENLTATEQRMVQHQDIDRQRSRYARMVEFGTMYGMGPRQVEALMERPIEENVDLAQSIGRGMREQIENMIANSAPMARVAGVSPDPNNSGTINIDLEITPPETLSSPLALNPPLEAMASIIAATGDDEEDDPDFVDEFDEPGSSE